MSGAKLQGGLNSEMETSWATSKGFGGDKIGTGVSPAVRGVGSLGKSEKKTIREQQPRRSKRAPEMAKRLDRQVKL